MISAMVCDACGELPRGELVKRLSVAEGEESEEAFVRNGALAEIAIAKLCQLDPKVVVPGHACASEVLSAEMARTGKRLEDLSGADLTEIVIAHLRAQNPPE
jgi:hypothetical protein